jgi:hypothetical protein
VNGSTTQVQHGGAVSREPTTIAELDVLEGSPLSRHLDLLEAADAHLSVTLWDCTAGRMRFDYWADEIVHILEGEAVVEDEHGRVFELRAGDVAHFARGSVLTWTVPTYVKKLAIFRHQPRWRLLLERVLQAPSKLLR